MAAERHSGTEENIGFIEKLADFIHKNRKKLLIGLALVALVLLSLIVYAELRKANLEKSTLLMEEVEKEFVRYLSIDKENEGESQEKEEELVRAAEDLLRRYPRSYGADRVRYILGDLSFEKKDWEKAAEIWTGLAKVSPRSHLAPLALLNTAASWEEAGEPEKAIQSLESLLRQYKDSFPEIPRVLFSLGRLWEKEDSTEKAKDYYDELIDNHPGGSWANLARNRLIYLQIREGKED